MEDKKYSYEINMVCYIPPTVYDAIFLTGVRQRTMDRAVPTTADERPMHRQQADETGA